MGEVIDISPAAVRSDGRRPSLGKAERTLLKTARILVHATEQQIVQQILILRDRHSNAVQVEEACYALPLLDDLLRERRAYLRLLQQELLGPAAQG